MGAYRVGRTSIVIITLLLPCGQLFGLESSPTKELHSALIFTEPEANDHEQDDAIGRPDDPEAMMSLRYNLG
jgi:hypothetical protein